MVNPTPLGTMAGSADPGVSLTAVLVILVPAWIRTLDRLGELNLSSRELQHHWRLLTLWVAAITGIAAASIGLFVRPGAINYFLALGCVLVTLLASLPSIKRVVDKPTAGPLPEVTSHRRRRWFLLPAAFLLVGLGFLSRQLIDDATKSDTDPSVATYAYEVAGTCSDGACEVNECATPTRCGEAAVGELKEEEVAEIVCQTEGGPVRAADGQRSDIWDQLDDGNFITDLYVDTPGVGRFTVGIPRCERG